MLRTVENQVCNRLTQACLKDGAKTVCVLLDGVFLV